MTHVGVAYLLAKGSACLVQCWMAQQGDVVGTEALAGGKMDKGHHLVALGGPQAVWRLLPSAFVSQAIALLGL